MAKSVMDYARKGYKIAVKKYGKTKARKLSIMDAARLGYKFKVTKK
jgi:hypothetical protein